MLAAGCLVVCLGSGFPRLLLGFLRSCRRHALGVAVGMCLRGVFLRVGAGCVGGSVGVAALGGVAREEKEGQEKG